ncbi:3-methyl-2-oxobutanoate hydroxymethyltransferase [Candidatus Bathyarchaeota archaeon]|nr:MAG: 3-methyl-2-oxobutanoate hydroxymethyltransferase [Candidatus Bathyarchaeota archaeon]
MDLNNLKKKGKFVMLTAYDYQMAKILDETGIDLILVGDSLGMVVLGYQNTKSVTMEDMIHHTRAVARGTKNTPIIGDMPIDSYNTVEDALENAKQLLEAGAHGVKIEGNRPLIVETLVKEGIPVMGHVGLLPQSTDRFRLKGKKAMEAERILDDAIELDKMGVFAIVLECIPKSLAKKITETVNAPTIGIGAGIHCDGQVLVINDVLGFDEAFSPKYLKRYANIGREIRKAIVNFKDDVLNGKYPDEKHTYH